ncbi:MAG TPA: 2-dehydropantoate 2-reductase [Candidatus Omnitrophota bacterium]|nr:2-dehydropantoate 2-reductase [Candidatus Omnitrophota bacterium]HPD85524.1 2-dehydropantoate 2-reductase [Candidatus Omnitrophota bacterium]HRZ04436.1 2-dehydropantoate 2-reductase [Candidatus Omnitrophota bacterium]
MKIAVIGAGAIGSVVAAYLSKAGEDVALIGKPQQVQAIRSSGLRIKGVRGEEVFHLNSLVRLDREYDLVIFTVKTQDLETAYTDNCEFLDNAIILTTQNGVQADNILSGHLEKEKIVSSIVMFGATYTNPGEVTFNFEGDWVIGKPFSMNDHVVSDIYEIVRKAFAVVIAPDIMGMKWLKLFVNFNNCLPALTGKPMQETYADMHLCRLSVLLLKEGVEAVHNVGVGLVSLPHFPVERILGLVTMPVDQAAGIINKTMTTLSKEPLYGSILQSILRKKVSEIDYINGEIVLLAKHSGLKVPLNRKVVEMVHEVENSGKFFSVEEIKKEFNLI